MTEEIYPVLGAFHGSTLVSTMRVEWVLSPRELQYKLTGHFAQAEPEFPAMYLTKAGTLPEMKGHGLNSILRFAALQIALSWKVRYVFGTMLEGSPRVFTMQEMGYDFQRSGHSWAGNFISDRKALLACLDLKHSQKQAFDYLNVILGPRLNDVDFALDLEKLQINEPIGARWPWCA